MNRIIGGFNPLNIDLYCAELIGYKNIEYLKIAGELNIGDGKFNIIETNRACEKDIKIEKNKIRNLSGYIIDREACSACYSTLVHALHRMGNKIPDEKFYIGQGFKGKSEKGAGIGDCTSKFARYVKGCPPAAGEIIKYFGIRQL